MKISRTEENNISYLKWRNGNLFVVYLESSTPAISKIINSNMVHDNENVVEKISCTNLWWTS